MDVSWAVWVAIEQLEEFARRSVVWDRVWGRAEAVERVVAVLVGFKFAVQVVVNLIFILLGVEPWSIHVSFVSLIDCFTAAGVPSRIVISAGVELTICACFPGLDRGFWQWLAGDCIGDLAMHVHDLRILGCVERDRASFLSKRGVMEVEGPEDRTLSGGICCLAGFLVCDFVHESVVKKIEGSH